jgi:hypothetical protein
LINSWKRERIFGTCLVETTIVDGHPKLPAGLGDDNRVDQPPWVVDLPDEADIKQLFDFFTDEVLPLNDCFWSFYWTGLTLGWIFRWCLITSLRMPGICDSCQANTSTLARRKVMSVSSYLSLRSPVMWVVWAASVPIWTVFTGVPSLYEGCTWVLKLSRAGANSEELSPGHQVEPHPPGQLPEPRPSPMQRRLQCSLHGS